MGLSAWKALCLNFPIFTEQPERTLQTCPENGEGKSLKDSPLTILHILLFAENNMLLLKILKYDPIDVNEQPNPERQLYT